MGNLINGLHPNLVFRSSPHALGFPFFLLCPFFLLYPAGKYKYENGVHNSSLRTQKYTKLINTFQKPSKGRCESLEEGEQMAKELEIWLDPLCEEERMGERLGGPVSEHKACLPPSLFQRSALLPPPKVAHKKPGLSQPWTRLKQSSGKSECREGRPEVCTQVGQVKYE